MLFRSVEALEYVLDQPFASLNSMTILSADERHRLLVEWNATDVRTPQDMCVHGLFEAQVLADAQAVALVHGDEELSYGELNARANRLEHYLKELGVVPDSRVGLCVERGFDMVVGLLAILKAGGAYVPLDPAYPQERLAFMLEDSAPVAVLTDGSVSPPVRGMLTQLRHGPHRGA